MEKKTSKDTSQYKVACDHFNLKGKKVSGSAHLKNVSGGSKFKIFVQPRFLGPEWAEPETVIVGSPGIIEGPEDQNFKVVDAKGKSAYDGDRLPPWKGPIYPKPQPDEDGNFDHYSDPTSREFNCCTMFATTRLVLDIFEGYHGAPIPFFFEESYPKMELIPQIKWDNAQSGYGFIEFGYATTKYGGIDTTKPYCQNFDVLAHEMGHQLIFSLVGFPEDEYGAYEYGGFHESAGDIVAIVASLHFDVMVSRILEHTNGNLFSVNELSRLGEISKTSQIRIAFNNEKMPMPSKEPHELSLPLTGAIFDILVDVFQHTLLESGLISEELAHKSVNNGKPLSAEDEHWVQAEFRKAYKGHEDQFKEALVIARDYLGALLTRTWSNLSPDHLTYSKVALGLLKSDLFLTGGTFGEVIRSCFDWRNIPINTSTGQFKIHRLKH